MFKYDRNIILMSYSITRTLRQVESDMSQPFKCGRAMSWNTMKVNNVFQTTNYFVAQHDFHVTLEVKLYITVKHLDAEQTEF